MSSCLERLLWAAVLAGAGMGTAVAQSTSYPGIGREATSKEVAAWNIDVRPDFQGLPKGSGSVSQGQDVWESHCASCHGVFGESNEVFSPLIGGVTAEDVKTGHVARLNDRSFPGRTTFMKVATVSTIWDYVNRAMPWNAPKSLKTDEVYSVVAYLLNMSGIVPDDFVLSDATIAQAQARMPNRNGMTTDHGLWPGKGMGNGGKPDVKAVACMKDCVTEPKVTSFLPDHARNNNGNLAQQQRLVGPQRGVDTTRPAGSDVVAAATAVAAAPQPAAGDGQSAQVQALLQKYACAACHGVDRKIVGPAFKDVAAKYHDRPDVQTYLAGKIRSGGQGLWGSIPMPPQTLPDADLQLIAKWLAAGASK